MGPARGRPLNLPCAVVGKPPSSSNQSHCTDRSSQSEQRQMTCLDELVLPSQGKILSEIPSGCDWKVLLPLLAVAPVHQCSAAISAAAAPHWALATLPFMRTRIFS